MNMQSENFILKNKWIKLLIIVLTTLILFNVIFPTISKAAKSNKSTGGTIFAPIQIFTLTIGDCAMYLANMAAFGTEVDPIMNLSKGDIAWWKVAIPSLIMGAIIPGGILVHLGAGIATAGALLFAGSTGSISGIYPDKLEIPIFLVTPEKIFSNKVPLLDVNIMNPQETSGDVITPAYALRNTIAGWYVTLRNLAIVGLLLILVYVGIRMIISSTASDKAKYKQLLMDWLTAFCLLFFMHYIMSFSITIVESITNLISNTNQQLVIEDAKVDDIINTYNVDGDNKSLLESLKYQAQDSSPSEQAKDGGFITDLMGFARFKIQLNGIINTEDGDEVILTSSDRETMVYTIIYLVLVIYTIMFLIIYIKRLIYIIFLTLISPLVVLTYPIDKITDGKAQAFNMWLKEYVYNLLIQPFHLILYNVLLGTSMELAIQYLIYPLVVLGFMLPAEKILRKFFGFEKSSTASSLASLAIGGSMVMKGMGLLGKRSKGKSESGKGQSGKIRMPNGANGGNPDIRTSDRNPNDLMDELYGSNLGENNNSGGKPNNGGTNPNSDSVLDKYEQDGYGKNTNGEYYNPYTDEYDPDYDPHNDFNYNLGKEEDADVTPEDENINIPEYKAKEIELEEGNKNRVIRGIAGVVNESFSGAAGTLGKAVLMGYGAATLGTIGIAAGLASDDYSNVIKYGVTGAGIGGAVGRGIPSRVGSAVNSIGNMGKDVANTYRRSAMTPEEYKAKLNRQADEKWLKDKENINLYKEKFGTRKIQVAGKNGDKRQVEAYKVAMQKAQEYRQYGVTDDNLIIKAMKVKVNGKSGPDAWVDKKKIIAAQYAKNVNNEKDVQTYEARLKDRGLSDSQVKEQGNMMRQMKGLI